MVMKKFNGSKLAQKFMQVGIDFTSIHTKFGRHAFFVLEILVPSQTAKFPFVTMEYSPWSSKI